MLFQTKQDWKEKRGGGGLYSPEIGNQPAAALAIAHENRKGKYAFFREEVEKNLIDIWKSGSKCVVLLSSATQSFSNSTVL